MRPLAYLVTFRCYASWLHGDQRGSVDRRHHDPRTAYAPPCVPLHMWTVRRLPQPPFLLDAAARATVDRAIRDQCAHAGWFLRALHVRTNHLHVVLSGAETPERMMNQMKAWATRRLREATLIDNNTSPWARHGSTRYLWTPEAVEAACRYVVEGQGAALP